MGTKDKPIVLTDEEERLIKLLAGRQHEQAEAESNLISRYMSRAALAKQIYTFFAGLVVMVVLGTIYVVGLRNAVDRNSEEILHQRSEMAAMRTDISRNADAVHKVELDMKDKVNRVAP